MEGGPGQEGGDKGGRDRRPEWGSSHPQTPKKALGDGEETEEILF